MIQKFTPLNLDNKPVQNQKKKKTLTIDAAIKSSTIFQTINTPSKYDVITPTKNQMNNSGEFVYDPKKFREMSPE